MRKVLSDYAKMMWHPIPMVTLGIVIVISLFASGIFSSSPAKAQTPTTMAGHWHQTSNDIPNTKMSADITGDNIRIYLTLGGATGVFWDGTFKSPKSMKKPFEVMSQGNQDVLDASLYGSSEKVKLFSYKNGVLTYQFSIMDTSTMINMAKG